MSCALHAGVTSAGTLQALCERSTSTISHEIRVALRQRHFWRDLRVPDHRPAGKDGMSLAGNES
jgi:hypothetical protein